MEERLSVIIDADIKNFQQGMARVESNLNRAQGIFKKASNAIFKTENAIAKLSKSFKEGSITNVQYSARLAHLNAELVKQRSNLSASSKEVDRLNKIMSSQASRRVVSSNQAASQSFQGLTKSVRGSSSVAIEFSRIIQDAPFGIIGIGNNIQQLTQNFARLKTTTGSTGAALKASLAAIISPANLLVLGISAITAAFTAYQMGAFDGIFATESLGKSYADAAQKLEDYRNSLDAVTRASIEGANQGQKEAQTFELLRAQAENANIPLATRIEAVKELQKTYPNYLGNLTQEQILTGNVGAAYEDLTAQIIATAKARAFSDKIAENSLKILTLEQKQLERANDILAKRDEFAKEKESIYDISNIEIFKEINDLSQEQIDERNEINRLKAEEGKLRSQINQQIEQGAKFTKSEKEAIEGLNKSIEEQAEKLGLISSLTAHISDLNKKRELSTSQEEINQLTAFIEKLKEELSLINAIAKRANTPIDLGIDTSGLPARDGNVGLGNLPTQGIIPDLGTDVFKEQAQEIIDTNQLIRDSFGALGTAIGSNLDISNNAVKGFVTTVLSNAPKLIQAIIAQAQASNRAADIANAGNIKQASGNAIVTATAAAKGLGPIGLAAMPILIGGALALISSAFGKVGSSGGVGGGSTASSGAPPHIFTNKQVQVPNQVNPDLRGFGSGFATLEARVDGDSLLFVLDQAGEKRKRS